MNETVLSQLLHKWGLFFWMFQQERSTLEVEMELKSISDNCLHPLSLQSLFWNVIDAGFL